MPSIIPKSRPRCVVLYWLLLLTTLGWSTEARAAELSRRQRPVMVGITIGMRLYPEELDLGNDFAFGGRVGLGLSPRWSLLMDFVASHTARQGTGRVAYVDALRVLGRANLMTGRFRPYVQVGGGGLLFLFYDSPTTAGAALTFGLGADYRLAPQTFLFVESSADLYSQRDITYDFDGSVAFSGPDRARTLGTVSAGIGVEF